MTFFITCFIMKRDSSISEYVLTRRSVIDLWLTIQLQQWQGTVAIIVTYGISHLGSWKEQTETFLSTCLVATSLLHASPKSHKWQYAYSSLLPMLIKVGIQCRKQGTAGSLLKLPPPMFIPSLTQVQFLNLFLMLKYQF